MCSDRRLPYVQNITIGRGPVVATRRCLERSTLSRALGHLVRQYVRYYNEDRPHMWLDGDAPVSRAVEPPSNGSVVALPRVGGIHHRYSRAA